MPLTTDQQQAYLGQLQASLNGVLTQIGRRFDAAHSKPDANKISQSKQVFTDFREDWDYALDELHHDLVQAQNTMRRELALHIEKRKKEAEEARARLERPSAPATASEKQDAVMVDADADQPPSAATKAAPADSSQRAEPAATTERQQHRQEPPAAQTTGSAPSEAEKEQEQDPPSAPVATMAEAPEPADQNPSLDFDRAFDELPAGDASGDLDSFQDGVGGETDFLSGLETYANMDGLAGGSDVFGGIGGGDGAGAADADFDDFFAFDGGSFEDEYNPLGGGSSGGL